PRADNGIRSICPSPRIFEVSKLERTQMTPIKQDPRKKLMFANPNKLMPVSPTSRDQSVQSRTAFRESTSSLSTYSRRIKISERSISISQEAGSCLWGDIQPITQHEVFRP